MALFTAAAAALATAFGVSVTVATIALYAVAGAMLFGISSLLMPKQRGNAQGNRIQVPPSTNNKLGVVYGSAFVGGIITDAKISTDLQTMWYVIALSEVPDGATMSIDELYYDGRSVVLDANGNVSGLISNNAGSSQIDNKVSGKLSIFKFPNGSSSGVNTGGLTAIQIMSVNDIAADQRWTSSLYTSNGQSASMSNTCFIIVRMKYNQDANLTGLGQIIAKVTCSLTKPGDVILDYMKNTRYGCAIPESKIDLQSLTDLNTYSDKTILYTPAGGGALTSQPRFRINGPINTNDNCLVNLQEMADACDSWIQYNEITGKWRIVINKAFNETPNSISTSSLYLVNDNNLIGGISVAPSDLNQTFNMIEYQYPNANIRDQYDFVNIDLRTDYPGLLSNNEPVNKQSVRTDLVNNFVQAKYIALRKLLQTREDLVISFTLDHSGIQIDAGDVVRVTLSQYGWNEKLFRVNNVTEEKSEDGSLFARITAFEYSPTIYSNNLNITDFIPQDNTGLLNPNVIAPPPQPVAQVINSGTISVIEVTGVTPTTGLVRYLDFNYGTSTTATEHVLYKRISNNDGSPLNTGTAYTIDVNDLPNTGTYFWSVTARNEEAGAVSTASTATVWTGGGVTVFNTVTNTGGIGTENLKVNSVTADKINVTNLSAISADVGTLTAGIIRNTADTYRVDVSNGRTIAQTGGYMKVSGAPFGSTNQFIEWYGPFLSNINSCTEALATYYLKTNGSAYFGGNLSAGILKTSVGTSSLSSTATIETGLYGSNGNTITVILSYYAYSDSPQTTYPATSQGLTDFNAAVTAWGTTSAPIVSASKSVGTGGTTTVRLDRAVGTGAFSTATTLTITAGTETIYGERPVPGDSAGYLEYTRTFEGSITYGDPQLSTSNRNYRATITARGSGILGYANNQQQRINIQSTEG